MTGSASSAIALGPRLWCLRYCGGKRRHRYCSGIASKLRGSALADKRLDAPTAFRAPSWPGLSPQVGFSRLAALYDSGLGQARVPVPSTSFVVEERKQDVDARHKAGHDATTSARDHCAG